MSVTMQDDHRTEFEMDNDVVESDVHVEEVFVNEYGDERAVLGGETYETKEIIKFDWDQTHHDYDPQRKEWIVDVDSLPALVDEMAREGYVLDPDLPLGEDEGPLSDLHVFVLEDDDIEVEYRKKNDGEEAVHEGYVTSVDYASGDPRKPQINFRRHSDDHGMYLRYDDDGRVGLWTGFSAYPFVGEVDRVIVHTDEERVIVEDEPESEDDDPDLSEWEVDF